MLPVPPGLAGDDKVLSASTLWPSLSCGSCLSAFYSCFSVESMDGCEGRPLCLNSPQETSISPPTSPSPSETHISDSLSCSTLAPAEWPCLEQCASCSPQSTLCARALRLGGSQTPLLGFLFPSLILILIPCLFLQLAIKIDISLLQ